MIQKVVNGWHRFLFADVDECQNGEHNCDVNAQCNNTLGSFTCSCLKGFFEDGVNCSGLTAFFFIVIVCLPLVFLKTTSEPGITL